MPRDIIANDTGLADRVRERFSSQEDVDALSPHQFELLAEQFGTVLGAHAGGTLDDYVSLMESWGGTLMLSEKDIADIRPGWKEPDHPLTIKRYAIDSLTLSVQQAPTQPRIRATAPGQFGLTFISQFHFKVRQWELLGKTQEAQVMLSAETNGGDQLDLQYSFLWSPQDDRWIPYQMTTTSRTGKPVASRIY